MNREKKKATIVIALKWGIAHAQGVAEDEAADDDVRNDAQKSVADMQQLFEELTGERFAC